MKSGFVGSEGITPGLLDVQLNSYRFPVSKIDLFRREDV